MSNSNNLSTATKDKKIKIIILAVTLSLTVIFILAAILTSLFGYRYPDYDNNYNNSHYTSGTLHTGSNSVYVSSSDGVYYSFTPTSTRRYSFYSSGSADTKAVLYDSNWSQLISDDDNGDGYNFSFSYNLTYGKTYYLKVTKYSSTGYVSVYVS